MSGSARVRTLLICHAEEPLHADGVARWLAARTGLVGIVRIHESRRMFWRRVRREWKRSGTVGLMDVLAFRLWYALRLRGRDAAWREERLAAMRAQWPEVPDSVPVIDVTSPNAPEAEAFIRTAAPEAVIALCKHILAPRVFEIPRSGTFVCHPGIAPEYRNAHGCYWAMANDDFGRVGMTMLRVDRGVDTGPVYGYFHCDFDPRRESHLVIQHRVLLDNLESVATLLESVVGGTAVPIPVAGRASGTWGQPTLSSYLRLRRRLGESGALSRA
ncbi:MAG TPA: formyltransferase family protein [Gemmatimonadales bacterium]|nr:formyltransferase family protein [Gemmatimonadales bacterium]